MIYLRPKSVEMPAMASDDIADEIATVHDGPGRWAPADAQHVSVGAAALGLLAGAILLALSGPHWLLPAAMAGLITLILLAAAITASRAMGKAAVAMMSGCAALPYAFVAGVAAVDSTLHDNLVSPFLAGTAISMLCGFALVVLAAIISAVGVARGVPVFFGLALAGVFGAGAAVITLVDPTASAYGAAALAVIPALWLTPRLPWIAFRFAGLAMPQVPANADDLRNDALLSPQPDVKDRAVAADQVVTGAVAGMGLTGAGAEIALGFGHGWLAAVTLAVLACSLLLHSRTYRGRTQRLWLMGPGYLGLAWLALMFGNVLTAGAIVVAAGVVVSVGSWLPGHRPSPFWGRAADIADIVLVIAIVPLALGVADVLNAMHGLNG
jgi:type VII secretion integral membrane protein EccD